MAVPISPATCCRIRSTLSSTEPFSVPSAGLLSNVIQPLYFVADPQENETRMSTASFSDKMLKDKEHYNAQLYWCSTVNKAVTYQICGPLSKYSTGLKKLANSLSRGLYYKTFYGRNLRIFIIS